MFSRLRTLAGKNVRVNAQDKPEGQHDLAARKELAAQGGLLAEAASRIEREFSGLVRAYDRARRDLERRPAELFEPQPEVSAWSIAQHRFHLCLASELVVRNLRALGKGVGGLVKPGGLPIREALPILACGILPRGTQAPRMVSPPDDFDAEFLREIVVTGREALVAIQPDLEALAESRAVLPHQTLGDLTAALWLRFGRMHAVHHGRIIGEIDAARRRAGC